ncbi:glycosyltransferase, partial [Bordetella pertussis]
MRIALLVDRFGNRFGGAEAYGVELMRILARRHDVTVVAREYDSDLALPFLPVRVSCRLPSWLRVLYFAWRAARLTRAGFDIVHSHMNGGAGDVQVMHVTPVRYNWLCRPGLRRRLTAWTSPRVATYLALEKARVAQRPGKRVVAVSELIVEQMRDAYGVGLPMETIPPGVQLPAPSDPARRAATRAALGWGEDDLVCLLV